VVYLDLAHYSEIARTLQEGHKLGPQATQILNDQIQGLVRDTVADIGGNFNEVFVKGTGDGAILHFGSPSEAHRFGERFHQIADAEHNQKARNDLEYRSFRVGIYTGEVILSAGEISGVAVGFAARLEAAARTGEILIDAESFYALPPDLAAGYEGEEIVAGKKHDAPFRVRRLRVVPPAPWDREKQKTLRAPRVAGRTWSIPVIGAAATMLCGLVLHQTPLGQQWENLSYDYLFRFGRHATQNVVLVTMDNSAYADPSLGQSRGPGRAWDRALHAKLLRKLATDQAAMVVFDVFFSPAGASKSDSDLAASMRAQGHVVLMQRMTEPQHPTTEMFQILSPQADFAQAAARLGVGKVDPTPDDELVRHHWPYSSPEDKVVSLPWAAAELSGARLPAEPAERWLRYYGENGGWTTLSYQFALERAPGYFSNKVVFVGAEPEHPESRVHEEDKFRTPYTRWNGKEVGGVEILATTYLNLVQGDWLRRVSGPMEFGLLALAGIFLGGTLCLTRRWVACGIAALVLTGLTLGAVGLSFYTNYWFDWATIVAAQLPVALAWALVVPSLGRKTAPKTTIVVRGSTGPSLSPVRNLARTEAPEAPDYHLCETPFGSGAYGNVWLARNAIGQWQALKAVYLSGFGNDAGAYDREFRGISRYKPVSEKHAGLLRIDFISQKKPRGYFYYVMELGDALTPGWEADPNSYRPRDLAAARKLAPDRRLPAGECVRIGLALCEALEFLHSQGLTHRDIKPGNIIFVAGKPKLADVGLITEIRSDPSEQTWVGTPAYMPPPPEPPGTVQADIYGLGMVLYVIWTGRDPEFFPGVSTTLTTHGVAAGFVPLNNAILKACQPDLARRFASAAEMRGALLEVQQLLERKTT
jgi:CHASE2 domain-containing sensor protein/class 3 adenylate cyclase